MTMKKRNVAIGAVAAFAVAAAVTVGVALDAGGRAYEEATSPTEETWTPTPTLAAPTTSATTYHGAHEPTLTAAERRLYDRAHADGYRQGYRAGKRDTDAQDKRIAAVLGDCDGSCGHKHADPVAGKRLSQILSERQCPLPAPTSTPSPSPSTPTPLTPTATSPAAPASGSSTATTSATASPTRWETLPALDCDAGSASWKAAPTPRDYEIFLVWFNLRATCAYVDDPHQVLYVR